MNNSTLFFLNHFLTYWTFALYYMNFNYFTVFKIKYSLLNQFLVTFPTLKMIDTFYNYSEKFIWWDEITNLLSFIILADVTFYLTHYILHKRYFSWIHRIHHTGPMNSVGALDANPIEHLLGNLVSAMIGPVLFQSHTITLHFWIFFATMNTVLAHTPNHSFSRYHRLHHQKGNVNYGQGTYILDRLFSSLE